VNWTELLKDEVKTAYSSAEALLDKVDPDSLEWKPASGHNWMTVGQLLRHLGDGCGAGCRGFVCDDWGLPPGARMDDLPPEEMLPPAEKLPAVPSVEEARKLLAADKCVALEMIDRAGEDALCNRQVAAPWAPDHPAALGRQLLQMVHHLDRHKSQLYYYLKLQGKAVNTADLWGLP